MSERFLTVEPKTDINDLFVESGSSLDFSPVLAPYRDPLIQGRPNVDNRFIADFYQKIGLDIVTETVMNFPYPTISEKTIRPIANGRPFIVIGAYRTLYYLRSLGFYSFACIIDESYDEIHNAEERFKMACKSIKKFVDRPIEDIIADVKKIEPQLAHNRHRLSKLADDQLRQIEEQIKID